MAVQISIFNWFFRKSALPYWCVVAFDFMLCVIGGILILLLRHPASTLSGQYPAVLPTFLAFGIAHPIVFRKSVDMGATALPHLLRHPALFTVCRPATYCLRQRDGFFHRPYIQLNH